MMISSICNFLRLRTPESLGPRVAKTPAGAEEYHQAQGNETEDQHQHHPQPQH